MINQLDRKYILNLGIPKLVLILIWISPAFAHQQIQSVVSKKPIISHIDIMENPVNFSRLKDQDYRETLPFGNELLQSFDSLEEFTDCPNRLELPYNLDNIKLHFSFPNKLE